MATLVAPDGTSAPPAIQKLYNLKKRTAAQQAKVSNWYAQHSSTTKPKTYTQQAIGVNGGRVFDQATGKLLGYSDGTHLTQYRPQNEGEAAAAGFFGSPGMIPTQPPRYYTGDEHLPANLSVPQRIDLQNKMEAIGLYGKNPDIIYGVWGQADTAAYSEALANANAAGVTVEEWLADSQRLASEQGEKLPERDPLVVRLTNPDDIRAVIQAGSVSLHNTYLTEDEIQKFITGYQDQERVAQTSAYDAEVTGGEVVDAPTQAGAEMQISHQIRTQHENQFKANTFTDRLDEVLNGLRGPASGSSTQVGPV